MSPAGVVELPAEVLAEARQVGLPVRCLGLRVGRMEQHLGIGRAAGTLDLLQQAPTLCVVGGEDLERTCGEEEEEEEEGEEEEERGISGGLFRRLVVAPRKH